MKQKYRTSMVGAALAVALTMGMGSALAAGQSPHPTVAVVDFTNDTAAGWWRDGVGHQLASVLSNELTATGSFKVVERQKVGAVLDEQDLAASGRVNKATGARIGNITGAQYLITGTVSGYTEGASNTDGGIRVAGFRVGGGKSEAYVAIDLRVINAETSEVVYSRTVEGRSSGGGVRLSGFLKGVGGDFGHSQKTPASKAVRAAIIEATDYLDCAMVKQNGCEAKYAQKDQSRREKDKDVLDLD